MTCMTCHPTSLSTTIPTPTPEVHPIQHRQNIARIVSSLRPVRPHTPFYRLAAHRVPTLWALYRGLLRASPSPIVRSNADSRLFPSCYPSLCHLQVRSHVHALFREHRHLTSPALTKIQLEKGQRVRKQNTTCAFAYSFSIMISGLTRSGRQSAEMNICGLFCSV